jgi:AraC-like DNA-binding protein
MSKCTALDRGFEIADGERPFARSGVPLEGNSVASARDIMTSAFMKHRFEVQHNPDFRFRVRSLLMENMSVVTVQYNAQARVVYDAPKEFFFVVLSTGDSFVVDQGDERITLPQGSLYVVDPELPTVVTLPAHYRQIIVRLDRAALQSYIRNDQGIHTRSRLQFVRSSVDGGGVAAALVDYVRFICEAGSARSNAYRQDAAIAVEKALISLLLASVPNSHTDLLSGRLDGRRQAVEQAERFIRSHIYDSLTIESIAAAIGVSDRTLYYAYQKHFDCSPMSSVKRHRLEVARHSLLKANETRVADIAYRCGFDHLSRFARAYACEFGELPSVTLQRAKSQRGTKTN